MTYDFALPGYCASQFFVMKTFRAGNNNHVRASRHQAAGSRRTTAQHLAHITKYRSRQHFGKNRFSASVVRRTMWRSKYWEQNLRVWQKCAN